MKRGLGGYSQLHEYFKTIIAIIPIEEFDTIIESKANVLDGCEGQLSGIMQISLNLSFNFRIFIVNSIVALVAQVDRAAVS